MNTPFMYYLLNNFATIVMVITKYFCYFWFYKTIDIGESRITRYEYSMNSTSMYFLFDNFATKRIVMVITKYFCYFWFIFQGWLGQNSHVRWHFYNFPTILPHLHFISARRCNMYICPISFCPIFTTRIAIKIDLNVQQRIPGSGSYSQVKSGSNHREKNGSRSNPQEYRLSRSDPQE